MKLASPQVIKDIVFIDKPAGFAVQASDFDKIGLREIFENHLRQKLEIIHDLGRHHTGILMMAKSPRVAQEMKNLFDQKKIKMQFLFVTANSSNLEAYEIFPHLRFERLKRSPFFELWGATSWTPSARVISHQATSLGLPILGDTHHGGPAFPHLCLHLAEVEINGKQKFSSFEPFFMKRLGLLKEFPLISALSALDRRQRLFQFLAQSSSRLCLMNSPGLRVDLSAKSLKVRWSGPSAAQEKDLERWNFIAQLLKKELQFSIEKVEPPRV